MDSNQIRKIGLIPVDEREESDKELYIVYTKARDNVKGSMVALQESLGLGPSEFYPRLDTDPKFREAIIQGFTDGRSARVLELESALIRLALGAKTTENRTGVNSDGDSFNTTIIKEFPPNLQALTVLLDRLKGTTWNVAKEVNLGEDVVSREIDYKMLTKDQLRKLAGEDKKSSDKKVKSRGVKK